jgi:hypothetical protein
MAIFFDADDRPAFQTLCLGGKMSRTGRRSNAMQRSFSNASDVRLAVQLITLSGLMLFLTGLVAETVLLR